MRFVSEVENGVYTEDPYADVHPELLLRYYGVDSTSISSEDEDEVEEMHQILEGDIAADMEANLTHDAVAVAEHNSPFTTLEAEALFLQALGEVQEEGLIPDHSDDLGAEFDLTSYPTHEQITIGVRRSKLIILHLPPKIWMPRAQSWVQALHALEHFILALD